MRTRGSVRRTTRTQTRRRRAKREEENICVPDRRGSASPREYLFTALQPADPRDEAHQGMMQEGRLRASPSGEDVIPTFVAPAEAGVRASARMARHLL